MTKAEIQTQSGFFDKYIHQVEENEVIQAIEAALERLKAVDISFLERIGERVYAPGKWTIKDIFQHMVDTERILAYRALRFARNDSQALAGFDEEHFAKYANASKRSLAEIKEEYILVKQVNTILFKTFDNEMLLRKGTAFKFEISVMAIGFVLAGHQNHQMRVLEERYYPLIS